MWYRRILTLLFPPRCVACTKEGLFLCTDCKDTLAKTPMQVTSTTWAVFPYHHPVGERLIRAMKFEGKPQLSDVAGSILLPALITILGLNSSRAVIIPIPTSASERVKRGYDHVRLLTESLAKFSGIETFPILNKIRETERQVTMKTREKRLKNLEHAFLFDPRYDLSGKIVVLVDDVTTTGATFHEASRALKNTGAERIVCLALAH